MRKITTSLAALCASTAIVYGAELNKTELPKMHATFAANPARFAHDYIGKPFTASLIVADITENTEARGQFFVTLGEKSEILCSEIPTDDTLAFNKGDTVNVTGTIIDHTPSIIKLNKCAFSRSVPVDDVPPIAAAPMHTFQAQPQVAPVPQPQTLYVPPAPPESPELRRIYGQSLYFSGHRKWWVHD